MPDNMDELYRILGRFNDRMAEAEERIEGLERTAGISDGSGDDTGFTTEDSFPEQLGEQALDTTTANSLANTGIAVPDIGESSWYFLILEGTQLTPPLMAFRGSDFGTAKARAGDTAINANSLPLVFHTSAGQVRLVRLSLSAGNELLFAVSNADIDPNPLRLLHWFDRSAPETPDAPTLEAGNNQLTVTWTKPLGFVNDYNIRYREVSTTNWLAWEHDGIDLTAIITGLVNGTTYEVQVQSANSAHTSEWSDSTTAEPVASIQITTDAVVFTSQQVFTDNFDDEIIGTSLGRWRYDSSAGSTATGSTGPGTNNSLTFIHTETSGSGTVEVMEANGDVSFATVPAGTDRVLHMRLCIQGEFGGGIEGLQVNHRASGTDAWSEAEFIHGWDYSNTYSAGDTITDENMDDHTCSANGGWIDFAINIPDTATQVQLQPRYIIELSTITHDIAFRQFHWVYQGTPP